MNLPAYIISFTFIQCVLSDDDVYKGFKVYQLKVTEPEQLSILKKYNHLNLDYWRRPTLEKPGVVAVPPDHEDVFQVMVTESGVPSEEIISDVSEFLKTDNSKLSRTNAYKLTGTERFTFNAYYQFEEASTFLDTLAQSYSNLVTVNQLGQTAEGRPLRYAQISTTNFNDAEKPLVVIEAAINGREWITSAASIYAINGLLESARYRPLLEEVDWIIIPFLNPDGYEFSHTQYRLWSKTRSTGSNLGVICPGINIDRNFDVNWGVEDTSSSPCSHNYGGSSAFSDSESQFLRDLITPIASRVSLYVSLQNGGGFVTYPWRYTNDVATNADELQALVEVIAGATGFEDYNVGNEADIFGFLASGSSTDYVKSLGVNRVVTIDIANNIDEGFTIEENEIETVSANVFNAIEVGLRSFVEISEMVDYEPSSASKISQSVFAAVLAIVAYIYN